MSCVLVIV